MSLKSIYNALLCKKVEPTKSIYERRIECFQKMIELQKVISETDEEYLTVSMIEGKHENAFKVLGCCQHEYRNLYSKCGALIKPY